jgi:glycosyltransferase involved in cell wall biosynthesis
VPKANEPKLDSKRIVSIGRLVAVKRHDLLIEAFALSGLADLGWELSIYGDGPLAGQLKTQIAGYGLTQSVFLQGVTDDVSEALSGAYMFVTCSEMEGFGLAVAEALNCGVPVIGDATCTGVRRLVTHERTGLLVSAERKVEGFARAMKKLSSAPLLVQEMSRSALSAPRGMSLDEYARRWKEEMIES